MAAWRLLQVFFLTMALKLSPSGEPFWFYGAIDILLRVYLGSTDTCPRVMSPAD